MNGALSRAAASVLGIEQSWLVGVKAPSPPKRRDPDRRIPEVGVRSGAAEVGAAVGKADGVTDRAGRRDGDAVAGLGRHGDDTAE